MPVILLTTLITFCALYAPQPLLPLFADRFGVGAASSGLLMTVVFVALMIAPLFYGLLLQRIGPRRLLIAGALLLGLLQFAFVMAPGFAWLLAIRIAQAVVFPAILTAAVTWCSWAGTPEGMSQRVANYVATTIVGGLAGRLLGGFLGSLFGWRSSFVLIGCGALVCAMLLWRLPASGIRKGSHITLAQAGSVLRDRRIRAGCLLIMSVFFAFAGLLNALPFRLVALQPDISSARISLVYSGYLMGVLLATNNARIVRKLGGEAAALRVGLWVYLVGILSQLLPEVNALVGLGFITCGGMFMIHSTLNGFLNRLRPDETGVVNGLYISVYYGAGALGSVVPLWVYQHSNWFACLAFLVAVSALGFTGLGALRSASAAPEARQAR